MDDERDYSGDYCEWCHAHYTQDCEDGCGCAHCKAELIQQVLIEIDIMAGEPVE